MLTAGRSRRWTWRWSWLAALPFTAQAAKDDAPCSAQYGEAIAFQRCNPARLADIDVRFTGATQPDLDVPLLCRNYQVTTARGGEAGFRQCSTGVLGGHATFQADASAYTVIFDVAAGCVQLPSGAWAPEGWGHAIYQGTLDATALANTRDTWAQAEAACRARPR